MISEEKMKIVINNYFKKECSVNTSIREAFEKGFRIGASKVQTVLNRLSSAPPEITDEQAIEHLQATGWMQNHDHEMYMMGRRDGLADDSDSYDSLIQPEQEDYTEMKREFIRMAEYIDVLLKVSDEQKETLIGFISRLAEFMPWTERD